MRQLPRQCRICFNLTGSRSRVDALGRFDWPRASFPATPQPRLSISNVFRAILLRMLAETEQSIQQARDRGYDLEM
jgi:hypothetical protein